MKSYYTLSILLSLLLHLVLVIDFPKFKEGRVSIQVDSAKTSFKVNLNKIRKKVTPNKKSSRSVVERRLKKDKVESIESSNAKSSVSVKNKFIPKYPYKSRLFSEEGVVLVRVIIDGNSKVLESTILESSGHDRLDKAALEASRRSSFNISNLARDHSISHTLEFDFRLDK